MISDQGPDDWESTDHELVFYQDEIDRYGCGECSFAKSVSDQFPGWTIVITMGPWREYDIHYDVYADDELIHLDCYSVAMIEYGPNYPRTQHSVVEHAEDCIREIAQIIKNEGADFDLTES